MKLTATLSLLAGLLGGALAQSAAQIAGQHVIWSYAGATPPDALFTALRAGTVGGIIFFKENVDDNLASNIAKFKAANAAGAPLLLMTDQEGGQVRRLSGAPTLSAKQMGASSNPASTSKTQGVAAADNLVAYGMNTNLAPVTDVFYTPGDFTDQFRRSFSNDSARVTSCASAFADGQFSRGVLSTFKHFPGLGSASATQNTDATAVTLTTSMTSLRNKDEKPYAAAIASGYTQLVMPSWAIYSSSPDPSTPAGLSSFWIKDELRSRLGFNGVTISDAIEAGSLKSFGSQTQVSVKAVKAGMDIILASGRDVTQGQSIVNALAQAIQNGDVDLAASSQRIRDLKAKL